MDIEAEPEAEAERSRSRTVRRLLRSGATALTLGGVGMLAAACGGGSASPGVASLGSSTTTTAVTGAPAAAGNSGSPSQQLAYTKCMQTHKVPNFPDPGPGAVAAMKHVDFDSPQFRAAEKACRRDLPDGGKPSSTPLSAKVLAEALKFAQCMRSQGVTSWPDPTSTYYVVPSDSPANSPTLVHAMKACDDLLPKP